jgi:hypothetical protein
MAAGALRGVHKVARTLELRQNSVVAGGSLRELNFTGLKDAFARLHGPPQARDMAANGVKALPMNGDPTPQALTLARAGDQPARRAHPKNCQDRNHTIQTD